VKLLERPAQRLEHRATAIAPREMSLDPAEPAAVELAVDVLRQQTMGLMARSDPWFEESADHVS